LSSRKERYAGYGLAAFRLNIINKTYSTEKPWNLTFSYGRALQEDALTAWSFYKKNEGDVQASQESLIKRANMNSAASIGNLVFN
jgi:fructose-bisphosphate aldolase class I